MESEVRELSVGSTVVYLDEVGVPHNALVTAVHGASTAEYQPCCNLVFVDGDESKTDPYGRQIDRKTSIVYKADQRAPGFYWMWKGEKLNPSVEIQK